MNLNAGTTAQPDPPPDLHGDAQLKWRETWPRLDHNQFDAFRDQDALAEYCEAWAEIQRAEHEIKNLAQVGNTKTDIAAPAQDSIETNRFYEQRAAAMDRFDLAAEKLGLSLDMPPSPLWASFLRVLKPFPQGLAAQDEKESGSIAPRRQRIWTLQRVWAALQRSFGNMARAARLLSETYGVACAPATISHLVKKYPQLREAVEECELTLLETCYDAIIRSASVGDMDAQFFLLRMWHPDFQERDRNQRT